MQNKKKLITLAIATFVGISIYIPLKSYHTNSVRKAQELCRLSELFGVLNEYVSANNGQLPDNWEHLSKSPFISIVVGPDNQPWMEGKNHIAFSPVRGSEEFQIAFGETGNKIILEKNSIKKQNGHTILLVKGTNVSRLNEDDFIFFSNKLGKTMKQTAVRVRN